jgi:hypothetical protein
MSISPKDTGPEMIVRTTPTPGVAQAILKAMTPRAQQKQSAPSISFAVLLVIVVAPLRRSGTVKGLGRAGSIPPDVEDLRSSSRLAHSTVTSRQWRCFVNIKFAPLGYGLVENVAFTGSSTCFWKKSETCSN